MKDIFRRYFGPWVTLMPSPQGTIFAVQPLTMAAFEELRKDMGEENFLELKARMSFALEKFSKDYELDLMEICNTSVQGYLNEHEDELIEQGPFSLALSKENLEELVKETQTDIQIQISIIESTYNIKVFDVLPNLILYGVPNPQIYRILISPDDLKNK